MRGYITAHESSSALRIPDVRRCRRGRGVDVVLVVVVVVVVVAVVVVVYGSPHLHFAGVVASHKNMHMAYSYDDLSFSLWRIFDRSSMRSSPFRSREFLSSLESKSRRNPETHPIIKHSFSLLPSDPRSFFHRYWLLVNILLKEEFSFWRNNIDEMHRLPSVPKHHSLIRSLSP